jgi:hypothetical protein
MLREIPEAFHVKEKLLTSGEQELGSAVDALQLSINESHSPSRARHTHS